MMTNRLIDTRLEFLSGAAVVEAEDIGKDNSVTVVYRDATVHPVKKGVYRFDAASTELRVYDGSAEVTSGDQTVEVQGRPPDRPGYAGAYTSSTRRSPTR